MSAMSDDSKTTVWCVPDNPTPENMRHDYLSLLQHIRDFKQDRLSHGYLSDAQLGRMIEMEIAGLVRTDLFDTTNDGKLRNLAPYYLLTDYGAALIKGI